MKRYIRSAIVSSLAARTRELVHEIEELFKSEDIPFLYVDAIEGEDEGDEQIYIVTKVYGDWRNDCDRAGELVEQRFHPNRADFEERDKYDYPELGLRYGSDSCIVNWAFVWTI